MHERKLYSMSLTSEQSFVSMCFVNCVSIDNIVMWLCAVKHIRLLTIDCACYSWEVTSNSVHHSITCVIQKEYGKAGEFINTKACIENYESFHYQRILQ